VLSYAPDVLLLPLSNAQVEGALSEVAALASQPGWWALPAVQRAQVYIVDPSLFSVPGPRIVEGVELLARILHPEHVDLKAPPGAVLKLWLSRGQRCRPRQLRNFFQPFSWCVARRASDVTPTQSRTYTMISRYAAFSRGGAGGLCRRMEDHSFGRRLALLDRRHRSLTSSPSTNAQTLKALASA
jgi:hypothetical protein